MKRVFVDSNVFLRFFEGDDPEQLERADSLFKAAARAELELVTGPPVLFEVAWTLRTSYELSREETLDVMTTVLALPGLDLIDRSLVDDAVRRAVESGQEFADAYIAASIAPSVSESIATFNRRHFEKLGITIHEF